MLFPVLSFTMINLKVSTTLIQQSIPETPKSCINSLSTPLESCVHGFQYYSDIECFRTKLRAAGGLELILLGLTSRSLGWMQPSCRYDEVSCTSTMSYPPLLPPIFQDAAGRAVQYICSATNPCPANPSHLIGCRIRNNDMTTCMFTFEFCPLRIPLPT